MRSPLPHLTLAAVTALTSLSGTQPAAAASTATIAPALRWGPCPIELDPVPECADLPVPLDYRHALGRQITIKISRIRAADPARRLGTLVISPGGPGVGGLEQPSELADPESQPAELRNRYDLVGFDARGIRYSSPVSCGLPVQDGRLRYPAPDGSIDHAVRYARHAADMCRAHAGDVLPYITTANTARDLDRIRAALGEDKISFMGLSYGTYLGAVYASRYPQRTDRFVLDSALDPNRVWYDFVRLGRLGLQQRLPDLTRWIADRDGTYHFGHTQNQVLHRYRRLVAALDADPQPYRGITVDGNWLRDVTRDALKYPDNSPMRPIANLWTDLITPATNAETAPRGAAETAPRGAAGAGATSATAVADDNQQTMGYAVQCGDAAWPRDIGSYARAVRADRHRFPDEAGRSANITACAFWSNPVEAPTRVTGHGPRNVLILQNRRDPATPLISGQGMRSALGQRATMIIADAGGHGVISNNDCATEIALRYLTADARELPADGRCRANG